MEKPYEIVGKKQWNAWELVYSVDVAVQLML
jgi:hypothetical protein